MQVPGGRFSNLGSFSYLQLEQRRSIRKKLEMGKINEIYSSKTKGCKNLVSIEEIFEISEGMSNEIEIYKHCQY